jgi:hypothetical protein
MADEQRHPCAGQAGFTDASSARWFVGDLGRPGVDQHEGLGRFRLGDWCKSDQLGNFRDRDAVAAGCADAALVGCVGKLLARVIGCRGLRLLLLCMGMLRVRGMVVLDAVVAGMGGLSMLRGRDLGRRMVRSRPAEQHRRSRQALQRDSGHDEPDEQEAEPRHEPTILLRLGHRRLVPDKLALAHPAFATVSQRSSLCMKLRSSVVSEPLQG